MTIIYIRYDVTTLAEVNALALTDRQQNDAIVLSSTGYTCAWSLPYATRNEGVGRWEYDYDGVGYGCLEDGDKMTVLVPIEAEEEWRASWASGLSYQECRTERQARRWVEQHDAVAMSRLVTPWEEA